MASTWDQLQTAFVDDHRAMTRGYRDLIEAIRSGDYLSASSLAVKLDRVAGPHIEFEEHCLYPTVSDSRGAEYTDRLYDEHAEVLSAIVDLQTISEASPPPTKERVAQWERKLQHGLDHAAACGSLLSHLGALSEAQQRTFLNHLLQLRRDGRRWSELHRAVGRKD